MGAAIGSGMGALAAEQAGADFLVALSAGRLRTMGVPSPASLLPIYGGTDFTVDFAKRELLGRTALPVIVGVPAFDPRIDPDRLLDDLAASGFAGVTNFPSLMHFGERQAALKTLGIGFDREVRFLEAARTRDLATIGYVRTSNEAKDMVLAGIDALCMNFMLNPSKPGGEKNESLTTEIHARSADILRIARNLRPSLTCFLGGGPIADAADLMEYCRKAKVNGFIGGSTLDQLPLERSLVDTLSGFRSIRELQSRVDQLEKQLHRLGRRYGLVAQSTAMNRALRQAIDLAKGKSHVLVLGELGTGRRTVANLIVSQSRDGSASPAVLTYSAASERDFASRLFGKEGGGGGKRTLACLEVASFVVIRCETGLSVAMQERLAGFMATGQFVAEGGRSPRKSKARLVFVMDDTIAGLQDHGAVSEPFVRCLKGNSVVVPPLRERIEDISPLIKQYAGSLANGGQDDYEFENEVLKLLLRHDWPGNLIEFREIVGWMVNDRQMAFSEAELKDRLGLRRQPGAARQISERDLIIEALLKHDLRRSETAGFLGVSRKTLYNKIKKYRIFA